MNKFDTLHKNIAEELDLDVKIVQYLRRRLAEREKFPDIETIQNHIYNQLTKCAGMIPILKKAIEKNKEVIARSSSDKKKEFFNVKNARILNNISLSEDRIVFLENVADAVAQMGEKEFNILIRPMEERDENNNTDSSN